MKRQRGAFHAVPFGRRAQYDAESGYERPNAALKDSTGKFIGSAPGSGDYNADGDNRDDADVSSYAYSTGRQAYLKGLFGTSHAAALANFPAPSTFGAEGNERYRVFRQPEFAEWDAAFIKNTKVTEAVNFQLRFEFFNLFNRANLNTVDTNLPDGNLAGPQIKMCPGSFRSAGI